jgi:hypothetical protein
MLANSLPGSKVWGIRIWCFGFVSDFVLRISDFLIGAMLIDSGPPRFWSAGCRFPAAASACRMSAWQNLATKDQSTRL